MKKEITIKIIIDDDKVGSMLVTKGLNSKSIEDKLIIVGALENMKRNQLGKLNNIFSKTAKVLNTSEGKKIKDLDEDDETDETNLKDIDISDMLQDQDKNEKDEGDEDGKKDEDL